MCNEKRTSGSARGNAKPAAATRQGAHRLLHPTSRCGRQGGSSRWQSPSRSASAAIAVARGWAWRSARRRQKPSGPTSCAIWRGVACVVPAARIIRMHANPEADGCDRASSPQVAKSGSVERERLGSQRAYDGAGLRVARVSQYLHSDRAAVGSASGEYLRKQRA